MEMNTENPFKDCQVLKLNGETTDPTIVYLDDEIMGAQTSNTSSDEDSNPMHLKICSDDEDSNQSMVVEPDEQIVGSTVSIRDENSNSSRDSSEMDICLKFEPPQEPIEPESEEMHYEEQFEMITCEAIEDPPEKTEEPDHKKAIEIQEHKEENGNPENIEEFAVPHDQSFESSGSASNDHDHSYSQSNPKETSSYCEDIVKDILSQSELKENPQALNLLSKLTNYLEIFTSNEDPNSQISQFVTNMKDTLNGKEKALSQPAKHQEEPKELPNVIKDEPLSQPQVESMDSSKVEDEFAIKCEEVDLNDVQAQEKFSQESSSSIEILTEAWDNELPVDEYITNLSKFVNATSSNEEFNDEKELATIESNEKVDEAEPMDVSCSIFKEEPQENEFIVTNEAQTLATKDYENNPQIKFGDAEKLQTCIKNAEDVGTLFTSISELSHLVYETGEGRASSTIINL